MKKFAVVLFSLALLLAGAVVASAKAPESTGPKCADFVNGGGAGYARAVDGSGTLGVRVVVNDSACKQVVYTAYVLNHDTGALIASSADYTETSPGTLEYLISLPPGSPDTVDIYVTSASRDGTIFDRNPDNGYVTVTCTGCGGTGAGGFSG